MMLKTLLIFLASFFELSLSDIRVGGAVNIFRFYGDLSIIMRVVPRHDSNWFFREGTVDVFDEVLEARSNNDVSIKPSTSGVTRTFLVLKQDVVHMFTGIVTYIVDELLSTPVQLGDEVLNGDFQMEFCDNLSQLMEAYFRGFRIDGSDNPWRAFTGGWSSNAMSKKFGLNVTYVTNHHAYVLVRVSRHRESIRMSPYPGLKLNNWTLERIKDVKDGDVLSVMDFIQSLGSHFVASYATGNSLYQILAYKPEVYQQMKHSLMSQGVKALGLGEPNGYFTPFYADHMGTILAASGNGTLEAWAQNNLRAKMYVFVYSSLLNLHNSSALLRELNSLLGNEALLQLELRTLAPIFGQTEKRKWFEEVMGNHLRLWEVNV